MPLVAELDGDARQDLVITQPGNVRVLAGAASATGQAALALALDDPSDVAPAAVSVVDLDGDGRLELLGLDDTLALVSRAWDGERFGAPVPVAGVVAPSLATPPVPVDLGGAGPGLDLLIPNLAASRIDAVAFAPAPTAFTAADLSPSVVLGVVFLDLDGDSVLDAVLIVQAGKGAELRWARGTGSGAAFRLGAPQLLTAISGPYASLLADPARRRVLLVGSGVPTLTFASVDGVFLPVVSTVGVPTAGRPYCAGGGAAGITSIGGVPHLLFGLQNRNDPACGNGHAPYEVQLGAVPLLAGSAIGTPAFTRIAGDGVTATWLTPDLDGDGSPELVFWLSPFGQGVQPAPVLHVWRRVPGTATFAP